MVFELTDALSEEIVQAMENQDQKFLVDAAKNALVEGKSDSADEENFYRLPEWSSAKGFELRQEFTNNLHNPVVQDLLKTVLHSGRGVFRNFKNELKNYPVVEKQWHLFKNKKMLSVIDDWYNDLREVWGLEKLEQAPEDNEYLLSDDFLFTPYSDSDFQFISGIVETAGDFDGNWPEQINDAVKELWQRQFLLDDSSNRTGFICRTLSDEFAGFITASSVSRRTEKVMILTGFFVQEKFRGLGIGSELLEKLLFNLKTLKKEWILLTNTVIPDSLEPLLLRSGFKKTGSGYSAQIQ